MSNNFEVLFTDEVVVVGKAIIERGFKCSTSKKMKKLYRIDSAYRGFTRQQSRSNFLVIGERDIEQSLAIYDKKE